MKKKIKETKKVQTDFRRYYLNEFELYDGECYVTFNIVNVDTTKHEITVAVTRQGKISVLTFDLKSDGKRFFFEYGPEYTMIAVDDFKEM